MRKLPQFRPTYRLDPGVDKVLLAMAGDFTAMEWAARLGIGVSTVYKRCWDLGVRTAGHADRSPKWMLRLMV